MSKHFLVNYLLFSSFPLEIDFCNSLIMELICARGKFCISYFDLFAFGLVRLSNICNINIFG